MKIIRLTEVMLEVLNLLEKAIWKIKKKNEKKEKNKEEGFIEGVILCTKKNLLLSQPTCILGEQGLWLFKENITSQLYLVFLVLFYLYNIWEPKPSFLQTIKFRVAMDKSI